MRFRSIFGAVALVFSLTGGAQAAPTLVDFSDQTSGVVANPLAYPTVSFASTNGLRVFSFATLGVDRALCPHATNACRSAATLTFAAPVNNLSFNVIQVDELGKFLTVTGFGASGAITRSIALTRGFNANLIDLSAIVGITQLTLDGTSDEEGVLYDNFRFDVGGVAGAVPEPATWATMMVGFGVVGGIVRRRKRATVPA